MQMCSHWGRGVRVSKLWAFSFLYFYLAQGQNLSENLWFPAHCCTEWSTAQVVQMSFSRVKVIFLVLWLQGLFKWWWPLAHSAGVSVFQHTSSLSWTRSTTMEKFIRKAFLFSCGPQMSFNKLVIRFPYVFLPGMWTTPFMTSSRWWAGPTGLCKMMRDAVSSCARAQRR